MTASRSSAEASSNSRRSWWSGSAVMSGDGSHGRGGKALLVVDVSEQALGRLDAATSSHTCLRINVVPLGAAHGTCGPASVLWIDTPLESRP